MSEKERKEIKNVVKDLKAMDNKELAVIESYAQGVRAGVKIAKEEREEKHD